MGFDFLNAKFAPVIIHEILDFFPVAEPPFLKSREHEEFLEEGPFRIVGAIVHFIADVIGGGEFFQLGEAGCTVVVFFCSN